MQLAPVSLTISIFISFLFLRPELFANTTPDICEELFLTETLDNIQQTSLVDILRSTFFPSTLVDISSYQSFKDLKVNPKSISENYAKTNYIFLIQPSGKQIDYSAIEEYENQYQSAQKKVSKYKGLYQELKNSDNFGHCRSIANKNLKNYSRLTQASMKLVSLEPYRRYLEYKKALRLTLKLDNVSEKPQLSGKIDPQAPLKWQVIKGFSLSDAKQILNSPLTGHIIIMSHADRLGRIYDELNRPVPQSFFKVLNPDIISLNFFSCYTSAVRNYYKLNDFIEENNRSRQLSFVKSEYESGDFSVLDGFPKFVQLVEEQILSNSSLLPVLSGLKKEQELNLKVGFTKGTVFDVIVNGNYLTSSFTFNNSSVIKIPSFYLRGHNNTIFLNIPEQDQPVLEEISLEFRGTPFRVLTETFPLGNGSRIKISI